ncbi:hypothetical protein FACS1894111_11010 [Clostridia bacterium]|nr:hypothetical protein FACS1894111_11010 [Clostridia bacterium]
MMEDLKPVLEGLGIDVDGALKRMMGSEALFLRLMKKFASDTSYEKLKEAIEKQDYEEAYRAAHTLKGASGNLGLNPIMVTAGRISDKLKNNDSGTLEADFAELTKVHGEIFEVLRGL